MFSYCTSKDGADVKLRISHILTEVINQEGSQEIIAEVNKMLEFVEVCCGGCL